MRRNAVVLVLGFVDQLSGVAAVGLNGFQHFDYLLVGTAVQRAPQGVDASRNRAVEAGIGRAHEAHGAGGAVLLVVGVQDEQLVEGANYHGVDFVLLGGEAEHHVQEVGAVVQVVARVVQRVAHVVLVGPGRDGAASWPSGE